MKCPHCKKEIEDSFICKELNIEIKNKVEQHNTVFNKLKIPKGWRIPTITETIYIANNYYDELKLGTYKNDFYFQQPFDKNKNKNKNKNKYVARLYVDYFRLSLYCNWDPSITYDSLGALFVKDLEEQSK